DGLARALARPEVPRREPQAAELDRLLVRNDAAREGRALGPLVAEERSPLRALRVVVLADLAVDIGERDDGDVVAGEQLRDRVVVVGMRMRDQHAEERLAQSLEAGAERLPVREQERRVD